MVRAVKADDKMAKDRSDPEKPFYAFRFHPLLLLLCNSELASPELPDDTHDDLERISRRRENDFDAKPARASQESA